MNPVRLIPEEASVNADIDQIEKEFFAEVKAPERKRGMAFQLLCISALCDVDIHEVNDEDIVDGSDEEGIDIINIDQLSENTGNKIVSILNCKSSERGDYSANDLTKLSRGLEYIFEEKESIYGKLNNKKLVQKITEVRDDKKNVESVNLYYCVFGGKTISKDVRRKRDEIVGRYEKFFKSQYPNSKIEFKYVNSVYIYEQLLKKNESLRGIEIKIPYYDKEKRIRPEIQTANVTGYVVTIKGIEIARLVQEYGDKLFEKNVRGWLKFKQSNKDIYDSCVGKESDNFWFMNNGLTIVGDKVFANDDKEQFEVYNLQIVNGQQTAKMIYEAYKDKKLKDDVKVICRIFQGNDPNFINDVAKSTNSQLSISSRDLMSNDPLQIALEGNFKKRNIFYERQRGQEKPKTNFRAIISSKKLAQISLAILCKRPSLARKNIEDNFFNKNKYYYEIFNKDIEKLFTAYIIFSFCADQINKENPTSNRENEIKYFGTLHIARIIWESLEKDKVLPREVIDNKINLLKYYRQSLKRLKKVLSRDRESQLSLGHYLSRIEVDELLFRELSGK